MATHQRQQLADALSGRYTIEREVGRGGMAVVYRARDLKHDRFVAIKVLKPELAQALGPERFLREIKLTAQLSHPHILPLLDSGEADGLVYYVMPFVEGESLRHRLDREKRLPLAAALRITREVADGLDSAHRHGIIHRDIKPENILLSEGHAVVADFGIARAVDEARDDRLTGTGVAIGTIDYMSPEQRLGGRAGPVGVATDIYALGCVLAELVSGDPKQIAALPDSVARVVRRATHEDPQQRYPTAATFAAALPLPADHARRLRIPAIAAIGVGIAIILVAPILARRSEQRAYEQLSRARALVDSGRWAEAYAAWETAESRLRADSGVTRLAPLVADFVNVTSEPPGAQVYIQRFDGRSDSTRLGITPIRNARVPRGDYRLVVTKQGFVPLAVLPSSFVGRGQLGGDRNLVPYDVTVRLIPDDSGTRNMVFVPGGSYMLMGPDMPAGQVAELDDFFIDKYEVSNDEYRAFVSRGNYPAGFRDRTGMAGPRGWTGQEYPTGRGRYPVTGVSWVEAAAFCAARETRLPTAFEWEKAARNGLTARGDGVMMPWGYVGSGAPTQARANFGGAGPAPVDAYPLGISAYGAYNMAGNVKEWTANPVRDGYGVTGGSWEDPIYLYSAYGAAAANSSAPTLGFRCARVAGSPSAPRDQGARRIRPEARTPSYTAVTAAEFSGLLAHYRYDRRPLEPEILETTATADWTRQKIRYVAMEGDTVLAYLFLPKRVPPPYQTMLYVCSSAAFFQIRTVPEEVEWTVGPNIRAGRAVLAVVFKGMAERPMPAGWTPPQPSSVRFRDLMVLHATELRRGIDYLETRRDIDMRRLSYVSVSWGAGSRLPLAGVDERFKAVILIGGGIDERLQPTLPEAANFNFAPHIRAPKLLLNGRDDEEHPWFSRALPLWNLLREPKQLVLVPGAGHVPPLEARVPAINRFLDQTLGPVKH